MKRSFREPKNRYKNGAKTARQKITTLNNAQTLENKGNFNGRKTQKSCKLASTGTKIRLTGSSKDD